MVLRVISIVIALIAFVAYSSLFVVDERQKALVLQFGQFADVIK
jgi:membrane protease subunit HflC